MITKESIKNVLLSGHSIKMHATNMVGGAVTFTIEKGLCYPDEKVVRVIGIVNSVEGAGFGTVDDVVSYIYKNRRRVIWYC